MKQHPLMALTPIAATNEADVSRRLAAMRACTTELAPVEAWSQFGLLADDFDEIALPIRRGLLETPLAWTDAERESARWIHRCSNDLSVIGHRTSESLARQLGADHQRTLGVMAQTFFFMGETVKWEVAVTPEPRHDFSKLHGLMSAAIAGGHHLESLQMRVDGSSAHCTLESLYFRVLLLARFAGGALNCKQIEILDAWMFLWMPALSGVATPPAQHSLRADLDSTDGLRYGPRAGDGPCLYLPREPIENAYSSLLAEFQAGRIVPATGTASKFRMEEHVAVLDLLRRGLRSSRRQPVARAERHDRNAEVEMLVGLAEVTGRPFGRAAPTSGPALSVVGMDGSASAARRETAIDDIYDAKRRMVRLLNVSDTGLGLECAQSACEAISVGDLVGVSIDEGEPPVIGKVVRSVPSKRPGRVVIGILRLSEGLQSLDVMHDLAGNTTEKLPLSFVPGADSTGRQDAFLVSERSYTERKTMATRIDNTLYSFRFNRVRQRGRGWVLAGFEVISARPVNRAA